MLNCLVKKLPCRLLKLPLLAVLACLPSISSAQNEAWEKISDPIFEQIPNYEEIPQRLYRRVGGIAVTPENGEIFAVINRDYGVFKSSDHGATWQKLENAPVQGRVYGSFSFSLDAETGRFAVFTQETNRFDVDPVGGMTVDSGKTWTPLPRPSQASRHDGFTWGGVDWTVSEPTTVLGKQHHAWIDMWLSQDAGQSWKRLDFQSRNCGVIDANTLVAGVDNFVTDRDVDIAQGIYRSTDAGETWEHVSEVVVNGKAPVHYGGNFYWTSPEGVLVTRDQGASWELLGAPLPGALYGPYFGTNEFTMMVVAEGGIFATRDAGATWQKLADAPTNLSVGNPTVSYGWDPVNGFLYYAPVGGDVFRLSFNPEF